MASHSALLFLLLCISRAADALKMKIDFGERKCFTEDVNAHRPVLLDFRASAGHSDMDVDLFVTDHKGKVVFHKSGLSHSRATIGPVLDPPESHGSLTAYAPQYVTYRFCFMHQVVPGQVAENVERHIDFRVSSAPARREKEGLITFRDTDRSNAQIHKLEEEILLLVEKMDVIREQERFLTLKNDSTSRFLTTVSSLTSSLVIAVGILQLEFVQSILRQRKMIH